MNGVLVQYYFFCKRRCYLHAHNIKAEHTSELVKIGKYYHKEYETEDEEDKFINGAKIDKIQGEYVIEFKKSNSDSEAAEWQLLFYLYKLKEVGIIKKGKLKFKENKGDKEVLLTHEKEAELVEVMSQINTLVDSKIIPPVINALKCKKCAFYEFCYV
jgi:CRISPR-associated exonuclease Cas4